MHLIWWWIVRAVRLVVVLSLCSVVRIDAIIYANVGGFYLDVTKLSMVVDQDGARFLLLDTLISNNEANCDLHLTYHPATHSLFVIPASEATVTYGGGLGLLPVQEMPLTVAIDPSLSTILGVLPQLLSCSADSSYGWLDLRWASPNEFAQVPLAILQAIHLEDPIRLRSQLYGLISQTAGLLELLHTIHYQASSSLEATDRIRFILAILGERSVLAERLSVRAEELTFAQVDLLAQYGDQLLPLLPAATFFGLSGNPACHTTISTHWQGRHADSFSSSNSSKSLVEPAVIARWLVRDLTESSKSHPHDGEDDHHRLTDALSRAIVGNAPLSFEEHRDLLVEVGLFSEQMFSSRSYTDNLSPERILGHVGWQLRNLQVLPKRGSVCLTPFIGLGLLDPGQVQLSHLCAIRDIFEGLSVRQLLEWHVLPHLMLLLYGSPAVYAESNPAKAFQEWSYMTLGRLANDSTISAAMATTLPHCMARIQPVDVPPPGESTVRMEDFYQCIGLKTLETVTNVVRTTRIDPSIPRDILVQFFIHSRGLLDPAPMTIASRLGIAEMLALIAPHEELLLRFGQTIRPLAVTLEYQKSCWKSHFESTFRRLIATFLLLPQRGLHMTIRKREWTPEMDGLFTRRETLLVRLGRAFIDGLIEDVRVLFQCNRIPLQLTGGYSTSIDQSSSSADSAGNNSCGPSSPTQPSPGSSSSSPNGGYNPSVGLVSRFYRGTVDYCAGYYSHHKQVKVALKVLARVIIAHPHMLDSISLYRLLYDPVLPKDYSEHGSLQHLYMKRKCLE